LLLVSDDIVGREADLGRVDVTADAIEAYLRWAGDTPRLRALSNSPFPLEAPPTFCLSLYRGMTPAVELPDGCFAMYGGHDIEIHRPIRAGDSLHVRARITDVFEKSGRSGTLTVVVRQVSMRDDRGFEVTSVAERQMIRRRQDAARPNE
jgi:acyl dehydratase